MSWPEAFFGVGALAAVVTMFAVFVYNVRKL